tara:strand:+ start:522 stop:638 length:117 start_codon:yes stop_codon:yes gene_type:complete
MKSAIPIVFALFPVRLVAFFLKELKGELVISCKEIISL